MPRSKAKKVKKPSKAVKRTQVGLRSDLGYARRNVTEISLADKSVFETMKTGFEIVSSGGVSNWGIQLTVPFVNVGNPGTASSSVSRMADVTTYVMGKTVNFVDAFTGTSSLSWVSQYLIGIFTKVLPIKMSFHYRAQTSTGQAEPLEFAYNIDPMHGATWGMNTTYYPAYEASSYLRDQAYSRSFVPYQSWDCPIRDSDVKLIGGQGIVSNPLNYNEAVPNAPDVEQNIASAGVISVKSRYKGSDRTGDHPVYGIIYLRCTLKLLDMAASIPYALFLSVPHRLPLGAAVEVKDGREYVSTLNGLRPSDEVIEERRSRVIQQICSVYEFNDDETKLVSGLVRKAYNRSEDRRRQSALYSRELLDHIVEDKMKEKEASTSSSNDEYELLPPPTCLPVSTTGFRAPRVAEISMRQPQEVRRQ